MRIALSGYGRMGKEIEAVARETGDEVVSIFEYDDPLTSGSKLNGAEVLISFSQANAVLPVLRAAAEHRLPVVEGTTGWYDQLAEVKEISGLSLLYSPNFSLGVYQFMKIIEKAAELVGVLGDYDTYIHEWHHSGKIDSPSGTARRLAEIVLGSFPGKREAQYDTCHRKIEPEELHVTSTRVGRIPGTHEVGFDSAADSIQIRHTAHGREAFARGAVKAAHWIVSREGIFTMDDFMKSISERTRT